MKWNLGATTRPWNRWTFEEACGHIADAGYTDVAVFANADGHLLRSNAGADEIAKTVETAAKRNLKPSMLLSGPQLNADLEDAAKDYRRQVDVCAEAGVRYLMDCGCGDDLREKYIAVMRAVAPHAEAKGVELQLKPHGGIGLNGGMLAQVHEEIGHPAFSICYDPGNIIYYTAGGERPEPDVQKVAPRVGSFIVKDCVVQNGRPDVWIKPGEGEVDFEAVLSALADAGFQGPLYVECLGGDDLDEINANARATFETLQQLKAKLAP